VVLYSDVVDALEQRPDAINFYIGHELGHIARSHLVWAPLLWPAGLLPLLGAAYSRAREYTCDRHGLRCTKSWGDAVLGMAALAAGEKRWKTINLKQYLEQAKATSGFWMSFHELTGDYPWLVKRIAAVKSLAQGEKVSHPGRNPLAWLLALFVPRIGIAGGAGSILIVVAIVGILAAIAIPAYQEYMARAQMSGGFAAVVPQEESLQAPDGTYSDEGINRALIEASDAGDLDTVANLLEQGADPNSADSYGFTPLIYAASAGNTELVRQLLGNGADIDFANKEGGTALWYAVTGEQVDAVSLLLSEGADTGIRYMDSQTPLDFARDRDWGRFPEIVQVLTDAEAADPGR
jgi:hypothetical protein